MHVMRFALQPLKRRIAAAVFRLAAPRARAPHAELGAPLVAGFLSTPSGIGHSARLCLAGLSAAGFAPAARDVSRRFGQFDPALAAAESAPDDARGPIVVHANPPDLPAVMAHLGRRTLGARFRVGYWAWELPRAPDDWAAAAALVHEIWTPSRFSAAAIVPVAGGRPVRVVPHFVPAAAPAVPDRAAFGGEGADFVALAVADFASSLARKNPLAAIAAHARAFGDDPRARLIVKLGRVDPASPVYRALRAAAGSNVVFLERTLTHDEWRTLLGSVDCFVSLHRAEGFGLVLAEAMRAAVPVVATAWSGNLDFMPADSARLVAAREVPAIDPQGIYRSGVWAEPDVEQAAAALAGLRADSAGRHALGLRGRDAIARFLDVARWRSALGEAFLARARAGAHARGACVAPELAR